MTISNLLVGLPMMLLCLVVQVATAFSAVRHYVRRSGPSAPGAWLPKGIVPLMSAMLIMMFGNFLQIVLWGGLFVLLGEFSSFYEAVYHSGVNYASLGYGDVVMSTRWKMLGPLEALNGILMLGMTGAALMAMVQQIIKDQRQSAAAGD